MQMVQHLLSVVNLKEIAGNEDPVLWGMIRSLENRVQRVEGGDYHLTQDELIDVIGKDLLKYEFVRRILIQGLSNDVRMNLCRQHPAPVAALQLGPRQQSRMLSKVPFDLRNAFTKHLLIELGFNPREFLRSERQVRPVFLNVRMQRMLPPLREYQHEIASKLVAGLVAREGGFLVPLPTGAGKTRTTVEALLSWISKEQDPPALLWMAPTRELCQQAEDAIQTIWQDLGLRELDDEIHDDLTLISYHQGELREELFQSQIEESASAKVIVSTPDQLRARIDREAPSAAWITENVDVSIVDEVHHGIGEHSALIDHLNPSVRIGLSATPDHRSLTALQDYPQTCLPDCLNIEHRSMRDALEEEGILAEQILKGRNREYHLYKIGEDITSWGAEGPWYDDHFTDRCIRDFVISELEEAEHPSRSILVFVNRITQAERIALLVRREMQRRGLDGGCEAVSSDDDDRTRSNRLEKFRSGDLRVLMNVQMLTTGFDAPEIDTIIIARSGEPGEGMDPERALYHQMVGRGLRGTEAGARVSWCKVITVT